MTVDVRIMPALPAHLASLAEVEREAARLFPPHLLPVHLTGGTLAPERLERGAAQELLWVALASDARVAGFVLLEDEGEAAWVAEVDVHPDFQRRGLGRRLLQQSIEAARRRGFRRLELTTFCEPGWNAPFYETLGFRRLAGHELDARLRARLADEAQAGLGPRVAMVLPLDDFPATVRD
jgi:GNAT superfamily N-acetyltransferase